MVQVTRSILLCVCIVVLTIRAVAQQLPYPLSTVIKGVTWDKSTQIQHGAGSDQWPMTWAADDSLYAAWGDGHGWKQEVNEEKKSLGVTRISGMPPAVHGSDTWAVGPGSSFGKPDALIAFGKKLFMFWVNGDSRFDHDSYSAVSSDSGRTWTLGEERVFKNVPTGFRVRGICQFGKDYAGAPDNYLYVYFGMNRHPDIYLARVPKEKIFEEDSYEWFAYRNGDGSATWISDFNARSTVFHDNNGYLWHLSVVYNPGLKRYLLTKPHFTDGDDRGNILASISSLGIFDAPTPWGPWTTVLYEKNWLDKFVKFNFIIPAKYLGKDGRTFWLAWSGWPEYDNVNFMKGTFVLH